MANEDFATAATLLEQGLRDSSLSAARSSELELALARCLLALGRSTEAAALLEEVAFDLPPAGPQSAGPHGSANMDHALFLLGEARFATKKAGERNSPASR